jgi:beta-lactamase class A
MRALPLALALLLTPPLTAQWPTVARDSALEAQLGALASEVDGIVGIYVRHLTTGRGAMLRPDELFPTASMVKVPILLTTFQRIHDGDLAWDQKLTWADSLRYNGEDDLFDKLQAGATVPLNQVTLWMITTSDNAASLWLQALVGGGAAINEWLAAHGFEATRVNSRTPGRLDIWRTYGWGQTSPREIAEMVVGIREGRFISAAASEAMYRHLTRIYWNGEALSRIPPTVQVASKQGAVDRSRSEVVLVNAPHGDYVFSVITREATDTSYAADNQSWRLIRAVSALLWRTFEPDWPYRPPTGAEALVP